MTITCDGGTTFRVDSGQLTITKSDQPTCTIPLADVEEFVRLFYNNVGDGDDDSDFEEPEES